MTVGFQGGPKSFAVVKNGLVGGNFFPSTEAHLAAVSRLQQAMSFLNSGLNSSSLVVVSAEGLSYLKLGHWETFKSKLSPEPCLSAVVLHRDAVSLLRSEWYEVSKSSSHLVLRGAFGLVGLCRLELG